MLYPAACIQEVTPGLVAVKWDEGFSRSKMAMFFPWLKLSNNKHRSVPNSH
jgi:hypothetical protein